MLHLRRQCYIAELLKIMIMNIDKTTKTDELLTFSTYRDNPVGCAKIKKFQFYKWE